MKSLLEHAVLQGFLRPIDYHSALFLDSLEATHHDELLLAAALASRAVGQGHTCLPLANYAGEDLFDGNLRAPALGHWREVLLTCRTVAEPGGHAPLLLDDRNRLYLYRFFNYEERIARFLLNQSVQTEDVPLQQASFLLKALFPEVPAADDQMRAVAQALFKKLLVISGGPGTGKTHTVARILALLLTLYPHLRIGLAAPTGKAAARVQESLQRAAGSLPAECTTELPCQALTLHRLLGYTSRGVFRYNRKNPLPLDLLVVDEASMIDIPLMAVLTEALPEQCRLLLLGDRDQLASVEAGSLFADLCHRDSHGPSTLLASRLQRVIGLSPPADAHAPPMADAVAFLTTSYRFSSGSGIGRLARAVNDGEENQVERILNEDQPDLTWVDKKGSNRQRWLRKMVLRGFTPVLSARSVAEALRFLDRFRLLCAVHKGPDGVEQLNFLAEQTLAGAGLIHPEQWYKGRPILISRNSYALQLFNGDTGILWPDDSGKLQAWFVGPDGKLHAVAPIRLPEHKTAYAVTVHKAQGSEFEEIVLVLPQEDSKILSRELLYTGLTRAKTKLYLCADHDIVNTCIRKRIIRHSGLGERLWHSGITSHKTINLEISTSHGSAKT